MSLRRSTGKKKPEDGSKEDAPLAQLAEQLTLNQWVPGSSPGGCTTGKTAPVCGNTNRGCFVLPAPLSIAEYLSFSRLRTTTTEQSMVVGWKSTTAGGCGAQKSAARSLRPGPRLGCRMRQRLLCHVVHQGSGVAGGGGELAGEFTHDGFEFLAQQLRVDRRRCQH